MIRRMRVPGFLALVASVVLVGCGQQVDNPAGPSPTLNVVSGGGATLAPRVVALPGSGTTLKATAPTISAPSDGATFEDMRVTVTATNAQGLYVNASLNVEIQLWDVTAAPPELIASTILPQQPAGSTSWSPSVDLKSQTDYQTRARAVLTGAFGPWSSIVSFRNVAPVAPVVSGAGGSSLDEINPFDVTYLHRNIAAWPVVSTVTGLVVSSGEICVFHTGAGQFPQSGFFDISVEGNVWVFAPIGGKWYGATWDWLRPGQECKGEGPNSLGPEQVRIPPMDGGWRPQPGSPICFAISARARDEVEAGEVRTNIACTVVP